MPVYFPQASQLPFDVNPKAFNPSRSEVYDAKPIPELQPKFS
jgi:hypothetical protein